MRRFGKVQLSLERTLFEIVGISAGDRSLEDEQALLEVFKTVSRLADCDGSLRLRDVPWAIHDPQQCQVGERHGSHREPSNPEYATQTHSP